MSNTASPPATGVDINSHGGQFEELRRSASVGAGMAADIALNYPLWIVAKRMGVGIAAWPGSIRELYKGAGSLWVSLGPTTMIEDASKRHIEASVLPMLPPTFRPANKELVSSVLAGAVAAATFCSQVEHAITAAHTQRLTMSETLRHLYYKRGGVRGMMLPPGMMAMVGREMPFVAALFYVRPAVTAYVYGQQDIGAAAVEAPPAATSGRRLHLEFLAGFTTAFLTCPFSHVPSVVAAYQQGHGVGLRRACSDIYREGGIRAFWRGMLMRTLSISGTMVVVPIVLDMLGGSSHPTGSSH